MVMESVRERYSEVKEIIEDKIPGTKICTMDVMICSDGNYVGRNPNDNCNFYDCPSKDDLVNTHTGIKEGILERFNLIGFKSTSL